MKGIKVFYLMLALIVPVSVFLFLKFFGKNQFDVPPLFKEGVTAVSEGCPQPPPGQYTIPMDILAQMNWSLEDSLTLYAIHNKGSQENGYRSRILESIHDSEVELIDVFPSSMANGPDTGIPSISIQDDSLNAWMKCFLFLQGSNDLLLIDKQRRIRGYYQSDDREEVDRLIMEIKIILNKY